MLHNKPEALLAWLNQLKYEDLGLLAASLHVSLPPSQHVSSATHIYQCSLRIMRDVNSHVDPGQWHLFLGCRTQPFDNTSPPVKSWFSWIASQAASFLAATEALSPPHAPQDFNQALESVIGSSVNTSYTSSFLVAEQDKDEIDVMLDCGRYYGGFMEVEEETIEEDSEQVECLLELEENVETHTFDIGEVVHTVVNTEEIPMVTQEALFVASLPPSIFDSPGANEHVSIIQGTSSLVEIPPVQVVVESEDIEMIAELEAPSINSPQFAAPTSPSVQSPLESEDVVMTAELDIPSIYVTDFSVEPQLDTNPSPSMTDFLESQAIPAAESAKSDEVVKTSEVVIFASTLDDVQVEPSQSVCPVASQTDDASSSDVPLLTEVEQNVESAMNATTVTFTLPSVAPITVDTHALVSSSNEVATVIAVSSPHLRSALKPNSSTCFNHRAVNRTSKRSRPKNLRVHFGNEDPIVAPGCQVPITTEAMYSTKIQQGPASTFSPVRSPLMLKESNGEVKIASFQSSIPIKTCYAPYRLPARTLMMQKRQRTSLKPRGSIRGAFATTSQNETVGQTPNAIAETPKPTQPTSDATAVFNISSHDVEPQPDNLIVHEQEELPVPEAEPVISAAPATQVLTDIPVPRYNLRPRPNQKGQGVRPPVKKSSTKKSRAAVKTCQVAPKPDLMPVQDSAASSHAERQTSAIDVPVLICTTAEVNDPPSETEEQRPTTVNSSALKNCTNDPPVIIDKPLSEGPKSVNHVVLCLKRKIGCIVDETQDPLNTSPRKKFKSLPIVPRGSTGVQSDKAVKEPVESITLAQVDCDSDNESNHEMDVDDETYHASGSSSPDASMMEVDEESEVDPPAVSYPLLEEEWRSGIAERFLRITLERDGVSPALALDQIANRTIVKNAFEFALASAKARVPTT